MQSVTQPDIPNEVIDAGVDWITGTAQTGSSMWNQEVLASDLLTRAEVCELPIKPEKRLGYTGRSFPGFFAGRREGGSILVASGAFAQDTYRSIANVSDNISRLDVQVTVRTKNDSVHLARHGMAVLRSGSPNTRRTRNATIIEGRKSGETLTLGKRLSDSFLRIYDKGVEGNCAPARTLWRYEVECKRNCADAWYSRLGRSGIDKTVAQSLVWEAFDNRGLRPIFAPGLISSTLERIYSREDHDTLAWFEDSLSVTVARMIKRVGRERVLKSLGLFRDHDSN